MSMQVILKADVAGLGTRGDVVTVADGYFRNYLQPKGCLLYTSPSPRDLSTSRMPSSA